MINILVAGDYCPMGRIADKLDKRNYTFFDDIKSLTREADYSIVNLECPIVEVEAQPIKKCGPCLKSTTNAIEAMQYAGFDCATLANNHFRDYGDEGCHTTLKELEKANIDYVGGGRNIIEAQKALYKEFGNKRLAIVNFCENEFSIATETSAGAAPIDTVDNYNQITEARKNADYVLVIIHGGHEHYQLPSPRMKKLYRHFITLGADAVVNHHQHCFSGYEYYNGKPIVYGLGNFCFDWKGKINSTWNDGYMVDIKFDDKIDIELIPYKQCNTTPTIEILNKGEQDDFNSRINDLNQIITNDNQLNNSFIKWCDNRRNGVESIFKSYHNRYLNAAASRGWIKRPNNQQELKILLNYILCESHRDISIKILKDTIER